MVLVTGGGSALLSLPEEGITIDEKKRTIATLANAGASIEDVNRVRQCISKTKAGKLGMAAYPAKVWYYVGYMCVYLYTCVCVCVRAGPNSLKLQSFIQFTVFRCQSFVTMDIYIH